MKIIFPVSNKKRTEKDKKKEEKKNILVAVEFGVAFLSCAQGSEKAVSKWTMHIRSEYFGTGYLEQTNEPKAKTSLKIKRSENENILYVLTLLTL